ncbi:MAG: hypothetical protein ACLPN5_03865 [Roseiarcus sp.]
MTPNRSAHPAGAKSAAAAAGPPRFPAVVHVGVTGHRDLGGADRQRLDAAVTAVLSTVAEAAEASVAEAGQLFAEPTPKLRCISSLAEGADRVVAERALALGFQLQCPLPFPREEYWADFAAPESRAAFDALIAAAQSVFELDGRRDHAPDAYLAAGLAMLDQSDLLLAIWDGGSARGVGGTAQVVAEAEARGAPVIVIDAAPPHAIRLYTPGTLGLAVGPRAEDWRAELAHQVRVVVAPPETGPADAAPRAEALRFLAERDRTVPWYGHFAGVFERWAGQSRTPATPAPPVEAAPPDEAPGPLDDAMRWADDLAVRYGGLHRSFVILRYLLLLPAVVGALIGFYLAGYLPDQGWLEPFGFAVQALSLAGIVLLSRWNRGRGWLPRLADYRLLAELIRHQRYLDALGRGAPPLDLPTHRPEAAATWVGWYVRAAARDAGLPNDRMTPARLDELGAIVRREIVNQLNYHRAAALRYGTLAARLERIGAWLLELGFAAIMLRVFIYLMVDLRRDLVPPAVQYGNDIAALVFPGLAPVFLGLLSQGQFSRLAAQSRAMAEQLMALLPALERPRADHDQLSRAADAAARIMTREAADWRLTVKMRPLSLT